MIVVDTSVLVDLFRGNHTRAVSILRRLEQERALFYIPAVCCQEILQGAKNDRELELLLENLGSQRILYPIDPWESYIGAARIYFDCRRKGLTVRGAVDCFIAQLTLEYNALLLHDDEDFDCIRKVRPLKTLRK